MATHCSILAWRIPRTKEPIELRWVHRAQRVTKSWTQLNDCTHIHKGRTKILRWAPAYTGITYTEVDLENEETGLRKRKGRNGPDQAEHY